MNLASAPSSLLTSGWNLRAGEQGPASSNPNSSLGINRYQSRRRQTTSSVGISGYQWVSVGISGYQWVSVLASPYLPPQGIPVPVSSNPTAQWVSGGISPGVAKITSSVGISGCQSWRRSIRQLSGVDRAPTLTGGGQGFESAYLRPGHNSW